MMEINEKIGQKKFKKWKEPCLPKPVLLVTLVIRTITLQGYGLIVVDQIYIQEVANCTIVEIKVLNCKKSTLEECSQCTEIVGKYTKGTNTMVKCRLRREIFNITQIRKTWIWHRKSGIEYVGPGEKHGCYQTHQEHVKIDNREYKVDPTRVSVTARNTEIKNKPVTKLQNSMLVFEGECQKYITKNKYKMYETPVKLKDPFPWINWHSKTNRTAKVILKPGTYSGQMKTLYQISVKINKLSYVA